MLNKETNYNNYTSFEITDNQVAWILMISSRVPFVNRISDNGTLLQTICFGSPNFNFAPTIAFLGVISETDFILVQDLSLQIGNMSVSQTSGTDFSLARISTNLTVQYNMMVDYNNGIDVGISDPIIYKQYCYFLMESVSNGCMFSSIPIVKSQIDAQLLKKNIYMLQLFDLNEH